MKKALLAAASALSLCAAAHADAVIGVNLVSAHSKPGYQNVNPGLYFRLDNGLAGGAFRNSENRPVGWLGYSKDWAITEHFGVGGVVGVAHGYSRRPLGPAALPSAWLDVGPARARLTFLPALAGNKVAALHLSVEFAL
jgi:opacity protein-like surface antigen